jgi:hypothetical protein
MHLDLNGRVDVLVKSKGSDLEARTVTLKCVLLAATGIALVPVAYYPVGDSFIG